MPKLAALVSYILIGLTAAAHAEGTSSSAYFPAILSGILGFVGSLIGANFALRNFKRQRTFDKQLDWYERAAKAIYTLAEKIEIARTFQDELPKADEEARKDAEANLRRRWVDVQTAQLVIGRVTKESRFFATAKAIAWMEKIDRRVQKVADASEAFDPPEIEEAIRKEALEEVYCLVDWLNKACPPLIAEGVAHLGLDSGGSWWKRWIDKIAVAVPLYRNKLTR
jgi:hypothetical protein